MSNLNLYGIEREYLEIANQLIESGGEINEELEEALAINKNDLEVKIAKYGYVTLSFDNEVDLIDAEINRLTELKNKRLKAKESLINRVKSAMQLFGVKKIESQNIKILLVPSKQVVIEDESLVDDKFKKTKITTTTSVVKADIKKAIESGEEVKGAYIQENLNLQIK